MDQARSPLAALSASLRLRFGDYLLETRERRLMRAEQVVDIAPKLFDALTLLTQRAGQLVTKDEFYAALWPDTIVSETSLNKCIWQLRRTLSDGSEEAKFIETVPKRGYRFVAAVEVLPPASVDPVISAEAAPLAVPTSRAPDTTAAKASSDSATGPHRWVWLAAFFLGATVIAALWWWPRSEPPTIAADGTRLHTLALLPATDLNPEPSTAWLSTALGELTASEFSGLPTVRIVPVEVLRDFGLTPISEAQAGTPSVPKLAGADWVLRSTYLVLAPQGMPAEIRIDLAVLDTDRHNVLAQVSRSGRQTDLFTLSAAAGLELRSKLKLFDAREPAYNQNQSIPADPRAAQAYAEGLSALRRFDAPRASERFQESIALAAEFAPAHAALAQAWALMGYDGRARESAANAARLGEKLPRELRLLFVAQSAELHFDWPEAIRNYQALATFVADNPEYALRLAYALARASKYQEALDALDRLVHDAPKAANDPRLGIVRARAYYSQGDYTQGLKFAQIARAQAEHEPAPLLVAEAQIHEGWCLFNLNRIDEADRAYAGARDAFRAAGHPIAVSRAMQQIIQMHFGNEDTYVSAEPAIAQLLAQSRAAGFKRGEEQALYMQCNLYWMTGRRVEGRAANVALLKLSRELGDRNEEARAHTTMATLEMSDGHVAQAEAEYERAEQLFGEVNNADGLSWALGQHAHYARLRADFAKAQKLLDAADRAARATDNPLAIADVEYQRAILEFDRHALPAASKAIAAADTGFGNSENANRIMMTRGVQAELALAADRPRDALTAIEEGTQLAQKQDGAKGNSWFWSVQAKIQLALKDPSSARISMAKALAVLPGEADELPGLTARLYLAEDHWMLGEDAAAQALWQYVRDEADKRGLDLLRIEAAVGLGCLRPDSMEKPLAQARAAGFLRAVDWAAHCHKRDATIK